MWTARLNDVPQFVNDKAVTIEGKLYAFDCFDAQTSESDETADYLIDVYTFDATLHRWDILPAHSLPDDRPMIGRSVVAYGHYAYIWGGSHANLAFNGLYRFDTHSLTWSCPKACGEVPKTRVYHSACVLGHKMYIFGGFEIERPGYIHFLDMESLKWHCVRTTGEAPPDRCSHTASAIGTRMYVWGGSPSYLWNDNRYDNSLHYLETETGTWVRQQVEGVSPEGRERHCAFVYDRALYIFGGYDLLLDAFFADMHKYDLLKSRWVEVKPSGSRPSARYGHGCSVLGERLFVFSGFGPAQNHAGEEHLENGTEEHEGLTDLHVLHLAPTLQNLCLLAVIDSGLDVGGAPELIRGEITAITLGTSWSVVRRYK